MVVMGRKEARESPSSRRRRVAASALRPAFISSSSSSSSVLSSWSSCRSSRALPHCAAHWLFEDALPPPPLHAASTRRSAIARDGCELVVVVAPARVEHMSPAAWHAVRWHDCVSVAGGGGALRVPPAHRPKGAAARAGQIMPPDSKYVYASERVHCSAPGGILTSSAYSSLRMASTATRPTPPTSSCLYTRPEAAGGAAAQ